MPQSCDNPCRNDVSDVNGVQLSLTLLCWVWSVLITEVIICQSNFSQLGSEERLWWVVTGPAAPHYNVNHPEEKIQLLHSLSLSRDLTICEVVTPTVSLVSMSKRKMEGCDVVDVVINKSIKCFSLLKTNFMTRLVDQVNR